MPSTWKPPETDRLTQENRERIWRELRLAESLGAKEVTTLTAEFRRRCRDRLCPEAQNHQNDRRPADPAPLAGMVARFFCGSDPETKQGNRCLRGQRRNRCQERKSDSPAPISERSWRSYLISLLLVAGATASSEIVAGFLSPTNMIMFYLLAVVVAALRLGFRPALLHRLLGRFGLRFLSRSASIYSFAVADTQYLITFAGLVHRRCGHQHSWWLGPEVMPRR